MNLSIVIENIACQKEKKREREFSVEFDGYLIGCHQVHHNCICRWASDALWPGFGHVCVKKFYHRIRTVLEGRLIFLLNIKDNDSLYVSNFAPTFQCKFLRLLD